MFLCCSCFVRMGVPLWPFLLPLSKVIINCAVEVVSCSLPIIWFCCSSSFAVVPFTSNVTVLHCSQPSSNRYNKWQFPTTFLALLHQNQLIPCNPKYLGTDLYLSPPKSIWKKNDLVKLIWLIFIFNPWTDPFYTENSLAWNTLVPQYCFIILKMHIYQPDLWAITEDILKSLQTTADCKGSISKVGL